MKWYFDLVKLEIFQTVEMISTPRTRCSASGRETALQGALVLAKSGRLKLQDNILRTL